MSRIKRNSTRETEGEAVATAEQPPLPLFTFPKPTARKPLGSTEAVVSVAARVRELESEVAALVALEADDDVPPF